MQAITISRRALAAALPILALGCAAPAVAVAPSNDVTELEALIARFVAAKSVSDRFDDHVFEPLVDRLREAEARVPHYTTQSGYESIGYGFQHLTTSERMHVAMAEGYLREPYDGGDDFADCIRELARGLQDRQTHLADLKREYRVDEFRQRSNYLGEVAWKIFDQIRAFPVRSLRGLQIKLRALDEFEEEIAITDMRADLERIAAGEG